MIIGFTDFILICCLHITLAAKRTQALVFLQLLKCMFLVLEPLGTEVSLAVERYVK